MVSLADLIKGFISVKDICIILDLTVLCTVLYIYSCEIQPGSNILEFISWMTKKLSQKIQPATQCPKKKQKIVFIWSNFSAMQPWSFLWENVKV